MSSLAIYTLQIWILLCTDILARGVDFKGIDSVVNFDLPLTPQVYINRVGRAGRGLKKGKSITFFTLRDLKIMKHIVQIMKISGAKVPDYLQDIETKGLFIYIPTYAHRKGDRKATPD